MRRITLAAALAAVLIASGIPSGVAGAEGIGSGKDCASPANSDTENCGQGGGNGNGGGGGNGNNGCGAPSNDGNGAGGLDSGKDCSDAETPADTTAPALAWAFDGTAGANGWHTSGGLLSVACDDDVDGVFDGIGGGEIAGDGVHSVTLSCTDAAGNSTSEDVTISIDGTIPTIAWTGDGTYDVDEVVAVGCVANDATSGIDTTTCGTGTASASGNAYDLLAGGSVSGTATDVAGNQASSETSYSVVATAGGVCNLIRQWVTNAGVANSLCVKLQNAAASGARGNLTARAGQLGAYSKELSAQAGKHVPSNRVSLLALLGPMV